MHDIHSIGGGGGGRLFGSGGDRRMRSHHQNNQALKCPRCESLNTKFCYYNNYNLSQPRHFCKSCRRYWTKGGVLRSVPVGGGCRKGKRSKPKGSASSPRERKTNSHSSSESSSLTASITAATAPSTAALTAADLASASSSTSASTLFNFPDSRFVSIAQNANPSFDPSPPLMDQPSDGGIFPEIGTFTSMMTSSNDPSLLGFSIGEISASDYQLKQPNQEPVLANQSSWQHEQKTTISVGHDLKMQEISAGFLDQTAQINLSGMHNRDQNGGLAALDWQAGGDQGIFDLTGTVDHAYWSQPQWPDNDHPFCLP